ncbi:RNA-directed DNA polymerase from mobile element jockey [Trichonephila clavipes]|nr:RNA-directed DNA polymerase from mobile element jockey [Trichonephila clavipes]
MAGEKQLKTVIRGLPSDFDVDEIIQELGTHNITPEHVSVMRNRKQNKNMPLFLVVSRKCPANQAIQVTSIGGKLKTQISEHRNNSWQNLLTNLHPEDNSLYNLQRKLVKKPTIIPRWLAGTASFIRTTKKPKNLKTISRLFQENAEPYNDQIIELVESETSDFLANSSMQVPPLTSPAEISKIINKLQNKKASGPDNIPNYALKLLPLNAITHLTKIINTCLKHRFFPSLWKSANVIMLPKPNQNHKLAQNYRPISLLCATAKIYEKIILNRIKQHCDTINCIPPGAVWIQKQSLYHSPTD